MAKRILRTERFRARELYVNDGMTIPTIATTLGVHEDSVRSWSKKEHWDVDREEVLLTPASIGQRMKKIVVALMDQIDRQKQEDGFINYKTVQQLDKTTQSLVRLDGKYDDKGSVILAMRALTTYLSNAGDIETLRVLYRVLPGFYRSLQQQ